MKKALIVLGLLVLLSSSGIAAEGTKTPAVARTVYTQMDANGDAVISVTEHAAFWQGRFKDIDADNNGKLTTAEFNAATTEFFGNMDTDKNGQLIAKEYFAFWCGPKAVIPDKITKKPRKKMDANQDGKIDDDECVAFWSVNFIDVDKNRDGKITLEEFMAAMSKRFKEIDKKGDGFISIEEHAFFMSGKAAPVK
jgi:Ca2+-binding EF-hand superfamily protein